MIGLRLTFWVVIFNSDDPSARGPGTAYDGVLVQGLDGEWVDHTHIHTCKPKHALT